MILRGLSSKRRPAEQTQGYRDGVPIVIRSGAEKTRRSRLCLELMRTRATDQIMVFSREINEINVRLPVTEGNELDELERRKDELKEKIFKIKKKFNLSSDAFFPFFGQGMHPLIKQKLVSRINYFLESNNKVRILDLGAGSGVYWDKLFEEFPNFRGKVKILCLNASRRGFKSKTAEISVGTLSTLNESQLKKLGKFHLVFSFFGETRYAKHPRSYDKIKKLLIEPVSNKNFIDELPVIASLESPF
ncbi:MAG: hypothetical protein ABIA76_02690 [Candidatus Diapherotrites archaeon]